MNDTPDASPNGKTPRSVKVDEKVVRKMLQVNPELRQGRTTIQVKRDLEAGHAVQTGGRALDSTAAHTANTAPSTGASKNELEDAFGFFLRSKQEKLGARLQSITEKRRALDDDERLLKEELRAQLATFVALLDEEQVALHGMTAISKHKDFLASVNLTPAQLLEAARKARK